MMHVYQASRERDGDHFR